LLASCSDRASTPLFQPSLLVHSKSGKVSAGMLTDWSRQEEVFWEAH
jgi:hypothetical protein